jgi:hypothetical protein
VLVVVAHGREIITVIALVVIVVVENVSSTERKRSHSTDPDDPDAIIGDDFLLFWVIVEVLQLSLLGEVVDAPAALANGREGAEVLDHLFPR